MEEIIIYKTCNRCNKEFPIDFFYKNSTCKDGYAGFCKDCRSIQDYGKVHQGTITEFNNSKRKSKEYSNGTKLCIDCKLILPINQFGKDKTLLLPRCKKCDSFKRIFDKYGLTKDEYIKILEEQEYCCKICHNPEIFYEKLIVDHNHNTGIVRGLLCSFCNKALGSFKNNPLYLREAANYLENNLETKKKT